MLKKATAIILLALGFVLMSYSVSAATNENPGVCQPQDAHLPGGDFDSITVTAPEGKLITGYCVKAGSVRQGLGPEYVTLDEPAESVTITHSSGKDISHYIVFYVNIEVPPSTTIPPTTTVPPTTTPPTTVPPTTAPPTTQPPVTTTPVPSTPSTVATAEPAPEATVAAPEVLAYTGRNTVLFAGIGFLLVLIGASSLLLRKRVAA